MLQNSELQYIVVEGVIGAGKSSLAHMISRKLQARLFLEQFEENPFLGGFYKDRKRFAFQTQMFFLVNRYKQQQQIAQDTLFENYTVSDYLFAKDKIFAYLNLSSDELKLYEALFPLLEKQVRKPDLVVYLRSSTERLLYNIKQRNREIESNISADYIKELSEHYDQFFFRYQNTPLLIVNTTEIDFVNNKNDFEELFNAIFRKDRGFTEYYKPEARKKK